MFAHAKMMRSVSFVERIELDFPGNHFSHGLCLGDVDGDGLNELVIGNVDGLIAVFRGGAEAKLWKKCLELGMITSVAIGDVLNQGKNVVICATAEGVCHVFDLNQPQAKESGSLQDQQSRTGTSIRPCHSQHLSLNIKTLLVASIDSSSCNDVFVGYTDRAVGVFRWNRNKLVAITERLPLTGQVGSLSVGPGIGVCKQLLVAQAGGTYIPLVYTDKPTTDSHRDGDQESPSVELTYQKGSMEGVVGVAQRRNPTVCTEVVGGITASPQSSSSSSTVVPDGDHQERLTAICTLDGSIKLLRDESKQWELQVDHSLFSLHKLDITGSGSQEIVGCAWDGMTYIVDQDRNVVKYHVGENVCAFCAGYYGYDGRNVPCLVYTTFHNQLLLYHNVSLPSIPSTNLMQALQYNDFPIEVRQKWQELSDVQKRNRIRCSLYARMLS